MVDIENKISSCLSIINQLLTNNHLDDWNIEVNRCRSSLATTIHDKKVISFSKYFLMVANRSQVEGVALHEITHALLGAGYGHNDKFIKLCKKISPTTLYARHSVDIPIKKYIATCPKCGYRGGYNRNDRTLYCAKCFKKGDIVKFNFTNNDIKIVKL